MNYNNTNILLQIFTIILQYYYNELQQWWFIITIHSNITNISLQWIVKILIYHSCLIQTSYHKSVRKHVENLFLTHHNYEIQADASIGVLSNNISLSVFYAKYNLEHLLDQHNYPQKSNKPNVLLTIAMSPWPAPGLTILHGFIHFFVIVTQFGPNTLKVLEQAHILDLNPPPSSLFSFSLLTIW